MSEPKRALIYARLSPSPRGEEAKGGNIDQQVELSRAVCERNGWTVVNTITEVDASATSSKPRKGWQEVVRRIEAGEVDVVVGRHYDRLYRRPVDLEELVRLVEVHGVRLVAAEAGDDGLDLTTATGRAQARYMAAGAAMETDIKRERQVRGHERRASAGKPWWNTRPYGYEKDGTIREDEAECLREAYRAILAGQSLYSIAKRWNDSGHLTTKGNRWRSSNLRELLTKARNAGLHQYRGQVTGVEASWDPIVSREVYDAVVRILAAPGRRPENNGGKRKGLLTNVARCGVCGEGRMIRLLAKPKRDGSRTPMYSCRECRRVSIPAMWLDRYVVEYVAFKADPQAWEDSLPIEGTEDGGRMAELRAERTALERRRADLAELFAEGAIDAVALRKGTEKVTTRLAEVEQQLADATVERERVASVLHDLEGHLLDRYDLAAVDEDPAEYDTLRAVIDAACQEVTVLPRGKGVREPVPEHVHIVLRPGVERGPAAKALRRA